MDTLPLRQRADHFASTYVAILREVSFSTLANWPDWPATSPMTLPAPPDLGQYTFTMMKDTLPSGAIRIAIQLSREEFVTSDIAIYGFVISPDGSTHPLTEHDVRELT
jgi:hypothetical protein